MRAVNAHAASIDQDREYSPDSTWWLIATPTLSKHDRSPVRHGCDRNRNRVRLYFCASL
jgi:hypothetical protein